MSKFEGRKIGIKFTMPLINEFIADGVESEVAQGKNVTFSKQYNTTTYKATNLVDGDLTTNWVPAYFSTSEWVIIDLGELCTISKIDLRSCTMNYYPNYLIEGSLEGTSWMTIATGSHTATAQTKTHIVTGNYRYIKITGTAPSSIAWAGYSDLKIYAITESYINNQAFTVSGQEYQWLDGPVNNGQLLTKSYPVTKVDIHPTESNSILIEVDGGFRNVQGDITISYNQALGNLAGTSGTVANFTETFTPEDLEEGLTTVGGSYGVHEYIPISIGGSIQSTRIEKIPSYASEYIGLNIGGTIDLIDIDDINP